MALVLAGLKPLLSDVGNLWRLLIGVSAGGAIYGALIVLMWILARRPDGAESYIVKNVLGHRKVKPSEVRHQESCSAPAKSTERPQQ